MSIVANIAGRISHTTLLGKLARFPFHLVPRSAVVPVLGGINRGRRWIAGAGATNGLWIGNYEADHAPALEQVVRPGMVAYDVGANAGYYTLALSRLVGSSGMVYSFEPDAKYAHFLRRHLELNGIQNVTVIQAAVADSVGLVGFTGWSISKTSSYLVPAISLDSFVAAGHPAPAFIKMDIEGAEGAAIRGARNLLSVAKPVWLLATHSEELNLMCKSMLSENGYHFTGFDCKTDAGASPDFMALPGVRELDPCNAVA